MPHALVDSNVLLDVMTDGTAWRGWSVAILEKYAEDHILAINPVIYAEVSVGFQRMEDLETALPSHLFERLALPWEAAFLAGKCFVKYRRRGGMKATPLPDFFIGAHAAVAGMSLITRDPVRYRTYFPGLHVVAPD